MLCGLLGQCHFFHEIYCHIFADVQLKIQACFWVTDVLLFFNYCRYNANFASNQKIEIPVSNRTIGAKTSYCAFSLSITIKHDWNVYFYFTLFWQIHILVYRQMWQIYLCDVHRDLPIANHQYALKYLRIKYYVPSKENQRYCNSFINPLYSSTLYFSVNMHVSIIRIKFWIRL